MLVRRVAAGCLVVINLTGCALFREPSQQAVAVPHAAFDAQDEQPERRAVVRSGGRAVHRGPMTEPQATLQKSETDRRRWLKPNDVVKTYGLTSLKPNTVDPMQTASVATVVKHPAGVSPNRVCQGC